MKSFWQKYKESIAIFFYLLIVSALIYFGIFFVIHKIDDRRNEIEETILLQKVKDGRLKSISRLKGQIEKMQSEQEKFSVLLDEKDVINLIETLESIAQQEGIKIDISVNQNQKLQQQKESKNSKNNTNNSKNNNTEKKQKILTDDLSQVEYLSLDMNCQGRFQDIFVFMKRLENLKYINDVVSFKMTKDKEGKDDVTSNKNSDIFNAESGLSREQDDDEQEKELEAILTAFFYYKK